MGPTRPPAPVSRVMELVQTRRLILFLFVAIMIFATMYVLYSALATLQQLDVVESERDRWQRPSDILSALNLRDGSVVADVGSGAGYFALKLSPLVGLKGKVLAIDLRKLSLSFLWIRAALRKPHNIRVIAGDPDDPHLPDQALDAVLIANTYHEFRNPGFMLDHLFRSLRFEGRLVIVDRGPDTVEGASALERSPVHATALDAAIQEMQKHGFQVLYRTDRFIDRPGDDVWWLVVAVKPAVVNGAQIVGWQPAHPTAAR